MKIIYSIIIVLLLLAPLESCSRRSEEKRFTDTYREILVNAEQYGSDSARAAREMAKILEKEGYTLESFRETYMEFSQKKPNRFMNMLDSVRQSVTNEIVRDGNRK